MLLSLLLVLITLTHAEDRFYDTSYDCSKTTRGSAERLICTDEQLAKLDKELSNIYMSFYYVTNEIKNDQRAWMKQKNQCKDTACIQKAYESRITDLNASLNNEKTFPINFLNGIKRAQTQMEYYINLDLSRALGDESISEKGKAEINEGIQKDVRFKEEFFRFKNIYYKPPLIAEVQDYNDPRLKKVLGSCHDYRFIQSLAIDYEKSNQSKLLQYVAKGHDIEGFKLSIWTVSAKGKKWFFIYTLTNTDPLAYLVDVQLCQHPHTKDDLVEALKSNNKQIKIETMLSNETTIVMLVNYKNQDYFLETEAYYDENESSPNDSFKMYLNGFSSKPTSYNSVSYIFDNGYEILYKK